MNKKKIILSIIILISTGAVVCLLILPKFKGAPDAPSSEEVKSTFKAPAVMPPLSVRTDKTSYGYNENVKISILAPASKNIPTFESCEISIKRTENRSEKNIVYTALKEKYVLNDNSKECKEYKSGFVFGLDDSNSKSLKWDQGSCENGKVPAPAIPDDYSILASCTVKTTESYSGPKSFSDAINIIIGETASCKNKKIEIAKARYDKKGILSVEIKNIGTENIENVRIYLDECENNKTIRGEKDLGKIIAGSSISKTFVNVDCRYTSLSAHISECYDKNPESWASSDIVIP